MEELEILSARDRMEWLSRLIVNEEEGIDKRLRALEMLNKMDGPKTGETVRKLEDLLCPEGKQAEQPEESR